MFLKYVLHFQRNKFISKELKCLAVSVCYQDFTSHCCASVFIFHRLGVIGMSSTNESMSTSRLFGPTLFLPPKK